MSMPYPGHTPPVNEARDIAQAKASLKAQRMAQQAEESAARERAQHQQRPNVQPGKETTQQWHSQFQRQGVNPLAPADGAQAGGLPGATINTPPLTGIDPYAHARDFARTPGDIAANYQNLSGIGKAAPRMDPGWQLKGTAGEGVTIPDSARNYKGEKSYVDPYAGPTIDVDSSKDQRFSVNGQTSGAQTAAGIAAKYQVPGTTASFTPGTVTDSTGNVMAQNGQVTPPPQAPHWTGFPTANDAAAARTALLKAHPDIGQAGTAANQAFIAHAQQFGEPSAHANVASIVADGPELNPTTTNSATAIPIGFGTSAPQPPAPQIATAPTPTFTTPSGRPDAPTPVSTQQPGKNTQDQTAGISGMPAWNAVGKGLLTASKYMQPY